VHGHFGHGVSWKGVDMSKTVLIVEDDALQMKLVTDLLHSEGYATLHSVDGVDTVRLAEFFKPNLILMDLKLPHHCGLHYARLLKADKHLKNIPVLAITGFPVYSGVDSVKQAGCVGLLDKPISAATLFEAVKKHIH
jgi:two-component system cell cycle response regulator DivK